MTGSPYRYALAAYPLAGAHIEKKSMLKKNKYAGYEYGFGLKVAILTVSAGQAGPDVPPDVSGSVRSTTQTCDQLLACMGLDQAICGIHHAPC